MAGLASCTQNDPLCGTVENTSYSRICIPATYVGSCAPTFSVTGISCAGGGASLQWVLYPSTTTCANMLTSNPDGAGSIIPCENGRTTNYSATPTMTAGSCYILMFDGNAKAVCSWTFNMTAPTPVASFTSSASTACTVAPNNCVTFTNTSTCYNTANVTWTATGLANQTTDDATFCWTTSGSKTVTLTVGSGMGACTGTATANTTITVSVCCTPPTISLVSKTNVTCPGGTNGAIDISVSGGTAPYTYAWSNGGSTQDLTSLAAGNYTVTVTETGGCTATYTNSITAPAAWSVTNTTTNVLCPCASTGAVNITVSGATSPYTYLWSNSASVEDITSVVAGTYTVTITDSKSCTTTRSYAITEPAQISIALNSQTNVACFSQCNGSVTIQASGGTSPYDYSNNGGAAWQFNDQAAVTYSGLCAGSYTYTVRDANGCLTH
ncbi:MAG: hypothetical protein A3H98_03880 [Bacteroidetes bacterium RIFCSPLOWO2_02_FULL_36_8]|nr:MAG: hypothetical protein A3H98_03880 [Bacteroidetes bacterium RIFCSPLOWO2_02_FULL_36_8]